MYQCFRESCCLLTVCLDKADSLDKGARIDAIIINFSPVNHMFRKRVRKVIISEKK
jgi:hypothetical protein